jgi:hypothetical protein
VFPAQTTLFGVSREEAIGEQAGGGEGAGAGLSLPSP